jgi:hypothetical protein
MLFSRAGRDVADDFFVTIVLPIYVNNQQYGASPASIRAAPIANHFAG